MRKHKRNHPHPEQTKNCYYCEHCIYLGEGGYMCGMSNDIVIEDWQPTEDFNSCRGKEFVSI